MMKSIIVKIVVIIIFDFILIDYFNFTMFLNLLITIVIVHFTPRFVYIIKKILVF